MRVRIPLRHAFRFIAASLLLVLACATGCDSSEPWSDPGPKAAFDAFLMHYFRGEVAEAYEYVLPADRAVIEAPLHNAKLPQTKRPEPHEMLVVADVQNVYDIKRMELDEPLKSAPADGEAVKLILHLQDGTTTEATMVWSDARWYVDLPLDASEKQR